MLPCLYGRVKKCERFHLGYLLQLSLYWNTCFFQRDTPPTGSVPPLPFPGRQEGSPSLPPPPPATIGTRPSGFPLRLDQPTCMENLPWPPTYSVAHPPTPVPQAWGPDPEGPQGQKEGLVSCYSMIYFLLWTGGAGTQLQQFVQNMGKYFWG
jgi:hypothetical protein